MADTIVVNEVVDTIVIAVGGEQGPPGITDFNPSLSFIGDVTGSGTTGQAVTTSLANTQVVAGDYGSPSKTTTFTVDSKGRLQAAGETNILIDANAVIAGIFNSSRMPSFSGDVSTSAGSTVTTLASTGVNAGEYTKVTVDEKGRVTGGTNPSTLGTYGIIDAYTKVEVDAAVASATPSFDTLTGKPNTLAGYGIIDGVSGTQLGVSIATLGNNLKVPPSQLPSYIDSVVEYPLASSFPTTGVSGTIYIDMSTKNSYRWSGTGYVNVGTAGGSVSMDFINILGKPTTLAGYGILDGVNISTVGANSGLATLGPNGKLTTSQMPAAVDQIQEIGTFADLPVNGLTSTIYLVLDTNKIYRFSGSAYVEISSAGTADEAMKFHTARTISMTGDVEWTSGVFDGSEDVTGVASLKTSGVTAGTYTKVTVNDKGIITSATTPTTLNALGITNGVITTDIGVSVAPLVSGKIPSVNLPSYVDDVLEFASLTDFPNLGEAGKIYIAIDTNLSYRWATSVYVQISSAGGVVSVAALNITTNGNDVSSTVLNETTAPVITLNLPTANSTSRGALSATDWTIFNNKQAALVSGTTIKTINGASVLGSGDIVVASSYELPVATLDTLGGVRVDGTTITITSEGVITSVGGGSSYTLPPATTTTLGGVIADGTSITVDGTGKITANIASSTSQIKQLVKNNTGVTLLKGQAVYINGATGVNVTVALAQANTEATSSKTLGLIEADILNGNTGYVITEGELANFDTSNASTEGDSVWLSPTTAGGLVYGLANKPVAPNHMVYLGVVSRKNVSDGVILVKVQNGYELDELHNVLITTPVDGNVLKYDSVTSLWKNDVISISYSSLSGSSSDLATSITDEVGTGYLVFNTNPTIVGFKEVRVALTTNDIDLSAGNWFSKTISTATTFTVSNIPTTGTVASFILRIVNGGSATITWWSGLQWENGTVPILSASGRDDIGFYTEDGGTTWTGLILGKDIK